MDPAAICTTSKNGFESIINEVKEMQLQANESKDCDEATTSTTAETNNIFKIIFPKPIESISTVIPDASNSSRASVDVSNQNNLVDEITKVCDGLYVSGFDVLIDSKITELDIRFIINATIEKPNFDIPNVDVLKLDILDMPSVNIRTHLDLCADTIHAVKIAGGRTLVHCALGISRSVTMCLAYLVKYEKQNLHDAYFALKRKRPRIHPNVGFWRQLISFEADMTGGSTSVKMMSYPGGAIPSVYQIGGKRPMFVAGKIRK